MYDKTTSPTGFYAVLFIVAFALNTIWGYAQTFAFKADHLTWGAMLFFWTLATIVDALVTMAIYRLLKSFLKNVNNLFYLLAAFLGASCAIFFEQMAFAFKLWDYNEQMFALPVLGIGLLPFLQLAILVPLSIWLAKIWVDRRVSHESKVKE